MVGEGGENVCMYVSEWVAGYVECVHVCVCDTIAVRVTSTSMVQPTPGLWLDIVSDTLSKCNVHDTLTITGYMCVWYTNNLMCMV